MHKQVNNPDQPTTVALLEPPAGPETLLPLPHVPHEGRRQRAIKFEKAWRAIIGVDIAIAALAGGVIIEKLNGSEREPAEATVEASEPQITETTIVPESTLTPETTLAAETTIAAEPVNCAEMNIDIPVILEADRAKEAVSRIEFFFDDPGMVEQVKDTIANAASRAEVEGIMQHTFATRGVTVNFGEMPGSNWHESPEQPGLDQFKSMMENAVDAYARVPAALAAHSSEIYFANKLLPNDPEQPIYTGLAYYYHPENTIAYDLNVFHTLDKGLVVVYHELTHQYDATTCTAEFTQEDEVFNSLRSLSQLSSHDPSIDDGTSEQPNQTDDPGLLHAVPSHYALTNTIEDKAETVAFMTRNYADTDDAHFDESPLLNVRQQIMLRRLAEGLNMPEVVELFQFFDIYGIDHHPKQIINDDLSPVSMDIPLFENETRLLQPIIMPNGQTDNFMIATNGNTFQMYMEVKIPADESAKCDQNLQVIQLMELGEATMVQLTNGSPNTYIAARPGQIDPIDGKLVCMVQANGTIA